MRNRWKRLLREAFRLCREELPGGIDLVVIPRGGDDPELERIDAIAAGAGKYGRPKIESAINDTALAAIRPPCFHDGNTGRRSALRFRANSRSRLYDMMVL